MLQNVAPGAYVLGETTPPSSFLGAPDQTFTLQAGEIEELTFADERIDTGPPPSSFVATKVDQDGDPVLGACFEFFVDLAPAPGQIVLGEQLTGGLAATTSVTFSAATR